jgi:phage host-nuclease inhibitor protein Gam
MSKTRETRKVVTEEISANMAEDKFAEYADADAKIQMITSKMDVEITAIREKYADKLQKLQEIKEQSMNVLMAYAQQHPELFAKKKSLEMTHGVIGFRTGTPSLKTLKGFTWSSVTNLLKEFLPNYVRIVEEPAKDKLLADREVEEVSKLFPKVGIRVEQTETFFIEPKKEEIVV